MRHVAPTLTLCLAAGLATAAAPVGARADVAYTGVNLSGAEFGGSAGMPGTFGTNYTYPTRAEVDYYVAKGVNVFRLPFRWPRLQRTLGGAFDAQEFARLDGLVNYMTAKGARVILDPHDQARYTEGTVGTVISTGHVTNAHFADFWTRLADTYKTNDKVVFGLVNEPHGIPAIDANQSGTRRWLNTANAAIAAIRQTGAANLVLVPGNHYTGAHSWVSLDNDTVMDEVVDPGDNFAYEVHQYLDGDSSGTSPTIVNATVGRDRLVGFTDWARGQGARAFLGEFAVANSTIGTGPGQIGDEAITHMLDYMDDNADVWMGWTWWGAGPWWNDYMFEIEPVNLGQPNQADRPSMDLLEPRLAGIPEPASASVLLGAGAMLALRRGRRRRRR